MTRRKPTPDEIIRRTAVDALRRGDRPGQVAGMLCTYAGLRLSREPLARDVYAENLAAFEEMITSPLGPRLAGWVYAPEPEPEPPRRWWSK